MATAEGSFHPNGANICVSRLENITVAQLSKG